MNKLKGILHKFRSNEITIVEAIKLIQDLSVCFPEEFGTPEPVVVRDLSPDIPDLLMNCMEVIRKEHGVAIMELKPEWIKDQSVGHRDRFCLINVEFTGKGSE